MNRHNSPIVPQNEREEALVAKHQRDCRLSDAAHVGPLVRRRTDNKLVRLPDIFLGHTFDMQVACDRYLLGQGPGRNQALAICWAAVAMQFPTWPPERQALAVAAALRNDEVYRQSLITNPPAPAAPVRERRVAAAA